MRDTGGGFGQKIMVQRDEMCLMLAGPKVGAPVKWVEDRRENLLAAGKSRQEHADVKMAFDADGAIQAAYIDFVQDCGAYPTPWPLFPAAAVGTFFPGPYRVPRAGFAVKTIYTNTVGRAAYRGPWQYESLAREVLLDIVAREMGIDPASSPATSCAEMSFKEPHSATTTASPARDVQQALDARLQGVPRRAGRNPRGALPGRGPVQLRRAVDTWVRLRHRGSNDPSNPRAGSASPSPAAPAGTASKSRSSARRRRPRRKDRGRRHDQGDTAVTGGAGTAGGRSAS
jgi:hypothetical protein